MPGAIVPLGTYTLSGMKRARTAYNVGRYAYQHRKKFKTAARVIGRAYRKYRSRKGINRRVSGQKVSTKQYAFNGNTSTNFQKTLITRFLKFPINGTGTNSRRGEAINLRGFRLCDEFINNNSYPIELHYVVVQSRSEQATDTAAEREDDFFRDPVSTNTRATNFTGAVVANNWLQLYKCYPINRDKWNVITHKKRILDSKPAVTSGRDTRGWYCRMQRWYPVKKTITFQSTANDTPNKPYIVFWWWISLLRADHEDPPTSNVSHEHTDTIYFNNNLKC